ncbi:MAG: hypothetical protein M3316_08475 [Actinomycetota bacterium]|nr:hypothetical protein [Actinomycetota bacterium]
MLACLRFLVLREAGAETAGSSKTERTEGSVVGASISHPAKWSVERERYTYDDTYGFTLWESESGLSHGHGETPAVRVALAYVLRPGQIGPTVRESSQRTPTSR